MPADATVGGSQSLAEPFTSEQSNKSQHIKNSDRLQRAQSLGKRAAGPLTPTDLNKNYNVGDVLRVFLVLKWF